MSTGAFLSAIGNTASQGAANAALNTASNSLLSNFMSLGHLDYLLDYCQDWELRR